MDKIINILTRIAPSAMIGLSFFSNFLSDQALRDYYYLLSHGSGYSLLAEIIFVKLFWFTDEFKGDIVNRICTVCLICLTIFGLIHRFLGYQTYSFWYDLIIFACVVVVKIAFFRKEMR